MNNIKTPFPLHRPPLVKKRQFASDVLPSVLKQQQKQFRIVLQLFICISAAALALFFYIEKQNELTELRLAIPALSKETKTMDEENTRLKYEIERFESPIHLMELMRKPEFSHLRYPFTKDEIFLPKRQLLDEKTVN